MGISTTCQIIVKQIIIEIHNGTLSTKPVIYFSFAIPKLPFAKIDKTTNTHEFSLRKVVILLPTHPPSFTDPSRRSLETPLYHICPSAPPSPVSPTFNHDSLYPLSMRKGAGEKFPIALPTSFSSRFINDPTS